MGEGVITNYREGGGYNTGVGEGVKFYPYKKRGGGQNKFYPC